MRAEIMQDPHAPGTKPVCCAICGDWLQERIRACEKCGSAHHADCWEYNGGCGIHDCSSGQLEDVARLASIRWLRAATGVCLLGALGASMALWWPIESGRSLQSAVERRAPTVTVYRPSADRRVVYYGGPRSLVTYGNLGNMYARSGEYDLAIACYEKVLEIDPRFSYGHFNLGNLYYRKGDYTAANGAYLKALDINPGMTEAYCNLGIVCQREGHYDRALAYFRKALDLDPRYAGTYYSHLGEIAYEKGDSDSAMDAFERAIEADSTLAVPKNNLAYLWSEQGQNLTEAMILVEEALAEEPENPYFLDTKGWIFFKMGDHVRAEEYLEKAHARAPEDAEIRGHLVDVWAKLLR